MNDDVRAKWDDRHAGGDPADARPCSVLQEFGHLVPPGGRGVDLACGLGGNAQWLAMHGVDTVAWDLSPVAIRKLRDYGKRLDLSILAEVRDVELRPPDPESFDVIVVSHFLDRELAPALVRALRPGGLLFYQTWTREAVDDRGPGNPLFRLAPNELLRLFGALRLVAYREEGLFGDPTRGLRGEAWLVAARASEGN